MSVLVLKKWHPRNERILKILSLAKEFARSEKPVTVRQTFYHLVSLRIIPNTERYYRKTGVVLTKARKAGIIPFEWFVDRSRRSIKVSTYPNIQAFLQQMVKYYYRDTWLNQKAFVIVWVEKEALVGVISPITTYYNVPLFVGKGYSSWSTFFEAFKIVEEYAKRGKNVVILYLGDFDPSGVDICRDLQSRFETLGIIPYFERLALTKEQIIQFNLPHMPLKENDPRSKKFQQKHGNFAVELDALPPNLLRQILREGIEKYLDLNAFKKDLQKETDEKARLGKILQTILKTDESIAD